MEFDLSQIELTRGERNLILLQKAFPVSEELYFWNYSMDGELYASTCPEQELYADSFRIFGGLEKAVRYGKEKDRSRPMLIGSPIGMQWAVTFESERSEELMFVVGPVFYQPPFEREVREGLRPFTNDRENAMWAARLLRSLPEIPVMTYAIFTRYVMMVHNNLCGKQLGLDALVAGDVEPSATEHSPANEHDRSRIYLAERAMLQMVRNGDINYQSALQEIILLSSGTPIHGQDPLRQMKTSITVFTTLVSRAAMEGGMSPELAYPLGDSYIQAVEDCRDSGELSALAQAMYHDFIYRVHHLRTNPEYSHAIQKCCDYIELSLDKKIRAADLAALTGYAEYYLSDKFKKETGQSISSYIRYAKVERAKVLLVSTDLSVHAIAERLAFNTHNYFINCFRDITGYSPAQYRKRFRGG